MKFFLYLITFLQAWSCLALIQDQAEVKNTRTLTEIIDSRFESVAAHDIMDLYNGLSRKQILTSLYSCQSSYWEYGSLSYDVEVLHKKPTREDQYVKLVLYNIDYGFCNAINHFAKVAHPNLEGYGSSSLVGAIATCGRYADEKVSEVPYGFAKYESTLSDEYKDELAFLQRASNQFIRQLCSETHLEANPTRDRK